MKKLLLGMLILGSTSSFATVYKAQIIPNSSCNTEFGIGQIELALYDEGAKSVVRSQLNVVNNDLCEKGGHRKPSKLVDLAMDSFIGGAKKYLHEVNVNSVGVVTDIKKIEVKSRVEKKIYKKIKKIDLGYYETMDMRVLDTDTLSYDGEARRMAAGLVEMSKI